jgi:hypothetical protein
MPDDSHGPTTISKFRREFAADDAVDPGLIRNAGENGKPRSGANGLELLPIADEQDLHDRARLHGRERVDPPAARFSRR